jgi:hypothetical protein
VEFTEHLKILWQRILLGAHFLSVCNSILLAIGSSEKSKCCGNDEMMAFYSDVLTGDAISRAPVVSQRAMIERMK